jgi:hypothetical protein
VLHDCNPMAQFRLALVAALDAIEGPWTQAKGNESGIEIVHLMQGEHIRVDLESERLAHLEFDSPGVFPFSTRGYSRYRVCKIAEPEAMKSPTIVKVKLNGLP